VRAEAVIAKAPPECRRRQARVERFRRILKGSSARFGERFQGRFPDSVAMSTRKRISARKWLAEPAMPLPTSIFRSRIHHKASVLALADGKAHPVHRLERGRFPQEDPALTGSASQDGALQEAAHGFFGTAGTDSLRLTRIPPSRTQPYANLPPHNALGWFVKGTSGTGLLEAIS
jgi:hypothetical protein